MNEVSPKIITESLEQGTGFAVGRLYELHNEVVQNINTIREENISLKSQVKKLELALSKVQKKNK